MSAANASRIASELSQELLPCAACSGTGQIIIGDQPPAPCPQCKGTGVVTVDQQAKFFAARPMAPAGSQQVPSAPQVSSQEVGELKNLLREILSDPTKAAQILAQKGKDEFLYWREDPKGFKVFDSRHLKASKDACPYGCPSPVLVRFLLGKRHIYQVCTSGHIYEVPVPQP